MIRSGKIIFTILFLISMFVLVGCQSLLPTPKFDVAFSTPEKEPVYIEEVVYDDTWIAHCGVLICCWKEARKNNIIAPRPVPKEIYIRWFNYRQQKFYEANIDLPEKTKTYLRKLPEPEYGNHKITTGVLPNGEVVIWVSNGRSELTGTWIELKRVQGNETKGNPADYRSQTEDMRRKGEI